MTTVFGNILRGLSLKIFKHNIYAEVLNQATYASKMSARCSIPSGRSSVVVDGLTSTLGTLNN
jgi:hypothetical protein